MKKILVAVDFSELTDAVYSCAEELARATSGELRILHVAAPDPDFVGLEAGPQVVRDQRAHELRDEHRRLIDHADALERAGIPAKARLVEGSTVETILRCADDFDADLIVIGSGGRGALVSTLMGSVSAGVIKAARCPVVIVPSALRSPPRPHER